MSKWWIVLALCAGLACSGSDDEAPADAGDPAAALRARCSAEVIELCREFQRAEQLDCVRREVERCIREQAGAGG
ncbi:MAG: hypothetical protein CL910_15220 [Deltaproteobacteria bacterium]|jgi:hypothetical protein|nr:hypothetical protein [Deltaproteobacteria bacterium]